MTDALPDLPSRDALVAQSEALAPMRSRVLRRVGIAHRGPVLDLGAGRGVVTAELVRRSRGPVIALDRHAGALAEVSGAETVVAEATELPFASGRFALVFCQCVLLWNDARARARILTEVRRVLAEGGVLVAIEPDHGGAIEHPPSIAVAPIWEAALARAGADPRVGRKLPGELAEAGFRARVDLWPELGPASASRFDLLEGLPLLPDERARIAAARAASAAAPEATCVAHVPFVFAVAE